jgi:hypothetical protein
MLFEVLLVCKVFVKERKGLLVCLVAVYVCQCNTILGTFTTAQRSDQLVQGFNSDQFNTTVTKDTYYFQLLSLLYMHLFLICMYSFSFYFRFRKYICYIIYL